MNSSQFSDDCFYVNEATSEVFEVERSFLVALYLKQNKNTALLL